MNGLPRSVVAAVAFALGWLGHAAFGSWSLATGFPDRVLDRGRGPEFVPAWWLDRLLGPGASDWTIVDVVDRMAPLLLLGLIALLVIAVVSGRATLLAALVIGFAGLLLLPWAARLILGSSGMVGGYPVGGPEGWLGPVFGPTATLDPLARLVFVGLIVALVVAALNRRPASGSAPDRANERR